MLMDPAATPSGSGTPEQPARDPASPLRRPLVGMGDHVARTRASSEARIREALDAALVARARRTRQRPARSRVERPDRTAPDGYPPYHPLLANGDERVVNVLPSYQRGWPSGRVRWPEVTALGGAHGVARGDSLPDAYARYAEVHPDLGSLSLGAAVGTFREGTPWETVWPALDYTPHGDGNGKPPTDEDSEGVLGRIGDFNRVSGGLGQSIYVGGVSEPRDLKVLAYVWMPDATGSLPRRGEEEVPFLLRPGRNELGGLVGVRGEVELEVYHRGPDHRGEGPGGQGAGPCVARTRRTVLDACAWRDDDGEVRSRVHSERTATLVTELRAPTPLQLDLFVTVTLWAYRVGDPAAPAGSPRAPSGWALVDCAWNRLGVDRARVSGGIHPRVGDIKVSGFMVEIGRDEGG